MGRADLSVPEAPSAVLVIAPAVEPRTGLECILNRADLATVHARSAHEAIGILCAEEPRLVVLDLTPSEADGYRLLRQIRQISDVPVLAITRSDSEFETIRALRAGADDVVAGSPSPAVLVARTHALLRRARHSHDAMRIAARALPIAVLAFDERGTIVATNPAADQMLGYAPAELVGHAVDELLPALADVTRVRSELAAIRKDGSEIRVRISLAPAGETLTHALLIDLSASQASQARIDHMALHDRLTGLFNRARFTALVRQAVAGEPGAAAPCGVFLVDVDDFKLINESLGHREGDEVLREIGWRLRASMRPTDSVARFGGDSFAVLCRGVHDEGQVADVVRRIERAVGQPVVADVRYHMVTASIGGALSGPERGDADTLIRDAHTALSRAKRIGRGRFEMFAAAMHAGSVREFDLQQRLRTALDHDELHIVYQPVISLADDCLIGFEALLRWHSRDEDIAPSEFIPLAEQTDLILPIGAWALEQAITQLAHWQQACGRPDLTVAVNLSPRQLADERLLSHVAGVLDRSGVAPGSVAFEITETALMREPEEAIAVLRALSELGCRLMLDDFGTGSSTLANLARFPVDGVKIDRQFVERVDRDPASQAVVDAVAGLGRGLDIAVVAEGIETELQHERVRAAGCELGQGFHLARPLSVEDAGHLVRTSAVLSW